MRRSILYVLFMISTSFVGCKSDVESSIKEREPIVLTKGESTVNNRAIEFSFNLLDQLAHNVKHTENILFSPFGVSMDFSMMQHGAAGETLDQMKKALLLEGLTDEEISGYYKVILDALRQSDPTAKINIANSMWLQNGINLNTAFLSILGDNYGCRTYSHISARNINDWCSTNTDGKIKSIVSDSDVENSSMILANALMFRGKWKNKFERQNTKSIFTNASGQSINTNFMGKTDDYAYYSDDRLQAVCIPYGNGTYSMIAIKPLSKTAFELAQDLDATYWETIRNEFSERRLTINMPIFSVEYCGQSTLKDAMQQLGMINAFDYNLADFSRMSSSRISISNVFQKTILR